MVRKVIIRTDENGNKIFETEYTDEEFASLLSFQSVKNKNEAIQQVQPKTTPVQTSSTIDLPIKRRGRAKKFDERQWKLLIKTNAEIIGRKEQSVYYLYQDPDSGYLLGLAKASSGVTYINLGRPNKTSSMISTISKAVNAMPFNEAFTRRELRESLPANYSRGHILKSALDYLEYAGIIERLSSREVGKRAINYKRVKSIDTASEESGHDANTGSILK